MGHRCVNNWVVMWLHILVVSLLCVYVALFGIKRRCDCTGTCRSCFNVNFIIVFMKITCAFVCE